MIKSLILAGVLLLPGFTTALIAPTESLASLSYTRVSIESIDIATPSLTFKTIEGQVWTLQATSAEILKGLHRGDTCSVEIDLDNRVTKIIKVDSTSP